MLEGWPASSPGGVCVSFSDSIEPIHGNCYGRGIQVTKFFQGRLMIQGQRGRCSFQSHLCLSPIGAWTLQIPVPYSPPSVGSRGYTWTSFHSGVWFVIPIRPLGHFWHSSYPINLLTLASSLRSRTSSPTCEAHVSDGGQVGVSSVTDYDALDYGSRAS